MLVEALKGTAFVDDSSDPEFTTEGKNAVREAFASAGGLEPDFPFDDTVLFVVTRDRSGMGGMRIFSRHYRRLWLRLLKRLVKSLDLWGRYSSPSR